MKYIFILGRNPALSLAEIVQSVPGIKNISATTETAMLEAEPLTASFLNQLGGTIKIVEVMDERESVSDLKAEVLRDIIPALSAGGEAREGRIIFGLSAYGNLTGAERRELYMAGLALKKMIKTEGRRCRLVVSHEKQLSSVVVAKNKLIEEGAELVVVKKNNNVVLGRTIAIQEFEAYGERDFDRPGRSARRGMLPPKLAQMMINIAGGKRESLLDPFCGSGTVLGEALLLGYRKIVGSDLSDEACRDTAAYLKWLEEKNPALAGRGRVHAADARLADKIFAGETFDTIVAEPLLGPPQTGHETTAQLNKIMTSELVPLYAASIASLAKILSPGGKMIFSFPVFGKGRERIFVPLEKLIGNLKSEPLLPLELSFPGFALTPSGGALYERPDQHVAREIIILKK